MFDRPWEGGRRGAVRYTSLYVARLAILFVLLSLMAVYLLHTFYSALPSTDSGFSDLIIEALGYLLPFLPLILLAVPVGYLPGGTWKRLVARLVLNAYLLVVVWLFTSDLGYALEDASVDPSLGLSAERIGISVDITGISLILTVIPVCSVLDAVLEYRAGSSYVKESDVSLEEEYY